MASTFTLPARPPALPISKTCVFKTFNENPIHIDIYLPPQPPPTPSRTPTTPNHAPVSQPPLMLFIHGGGWTGSNRGDYSRPMFQHFLNLGFVVASMDYRLAPESSNLAQLEDVRDVERWLRHSLSDELGQKSLVERDNGTEEDRKIVVVGASAGAQLALMVPKLWGIPPAALLILYAPTNMHVLPYSGRGRLSALTLPPPTTELLQEATNYLNPPTQRAIPKCALDYLGPRVVMTTHVFREAIISELLLRGLVREEKAEVEDSEGPGDDELLSLPTKGSVSVEEVDEICPLSYLSSRLSSPSSSSYPPTYLLTGTADEVFSPNSHSIPFYNELLRQNVPAELKLVPGLGHAFDVWAEIGSAIGEEILRPAVGWIGEVVGVMEG